MLSPVIAAELDKLSSVPEYVRQTMNKAASDGGGDVSVLPASAFADGAQRQYPRHTKSATYTSVVKYITENDTRKGVMAELLKSAATFGITDDVARAVKELQEKAQQPKSAAYEYYAIPEHNYFPIHSPELLTESMAQLEKEAKKLTFRMRHEAAVNMAKAAAVFDMDVTEYVKRASGSKPTTIAKVASALYDRVTPDSKHRDAYVTAAANLRKAASEGKVALTARLPRDYALQLTTAIEVMDKAAGLHGRYGSIPTPEDMVFEGFVREAPIVKLANGFPVDMDAVKQSSLKLDDLAPLGQEFCDRVMNDCTMAIAIKAAEFTGGGDMNINYTKLAEELPNLSLGDAKTFYDIYRKAQK